MGEGKQWTAEEIRAALVEASPGFLAMADEMKRVFGARLMYLHVTRSDGSVLEIGRAWKERLDAPPKFRPLTAEEHKRCHLASVADHAKRQAEQARAVARSSTRKPRRK